MKKLLLAATLVIGGIFAANADYLYWSISSTNPEDETANVSTLYAYHGGSYYALSTAEGFTGSYNTSEWIGGGFDLNSNETTYYVELANYESSTYTATGNYGALTYSDISVTLTSLSKIETAWGGASYRVGAVPEPTSGLLMLMGFAMLGLKRKKEV